MRQRMSSKMRSFKNCKEECNRPWVKASQGSDPATCTKMVASGRQVTLMSLTCSICHQCCVTAFQIKWSAAITLRVSKRACCASKSQVLLSQTIMSKRSKSFWRTKRLKMCAKRNSERSTTSKLSKRKPKLWWAARRREACNTRTLLKHSQQSWWRQTSKRLPRKSSMPKSSRKQTETDHQQARKNSLPISSLAPETTCSKPQIMTA